jgi:lipoate-protein ligase A
LFKKEISSDFILKISNFIIKEFEKALKINFENYNYSKKNLEKIDYLLKNKYLLDSWNKKI